MSARSRVQTSVQPVQVNDQTHYLTRTDGERTLHHVVLDGVYATPQNLQAMVHLFDDKPGHVYLGARTNALSLYATMTPDEAALLGRALVCAAAEAMQRQEYAREDAAKAARAA